MKKKNLLLILILLSPLCCLADTASNKPTDTEVWIAFLPVIFFTIILIIAAFKLKAGDSKSPGFLTEKESAAATTDKDDSAPPQSTSRVVAFLTGLVALTTGICLTTFFIYEYFVNPNKPADLSNLSSVIWGLGIGV